MIATTFGVGQVAYSFLWLALLFVEVWLMVSVFIDIFRSHDLKGWAKALWVLLVLAVPLLGILLYFILRGDKMRAHQQQAQYDEQAFEDYLLRRNGASGDAAGQLSRLSALRRDGVISDEEFEQFKARVVQQDSSAGVS